jgi:NAD(P)-dependent dehydrogenase (short-subunit alcohol dehydrogenase family)
MSAAPVRIEPAAVSSQAIEAHDHDSRYRISRTRHRRGRRYRACHRRYAGRGGLDALVNNAGIAGPTAAVEEIDPADWRRTIEVNLNSHFYCARRAAPLLKASQGVMINISSVAGRLGYAYRTPYAASKWAIIGMTESLAKELGAFGVRVNAILPGMVAGPRIERVIAAKAEALGLSYQQVETQYLDRISLHRMVSAQEIANMALFLCSDEGRNISGQSLSVCAGTENI